MHAPDRDPYAAPASRVDDGAAGRSLVRRTIAACGWFLLVMAGLAIYLWLAGIGASFWTKSAVVWLMATPVASMLARQRMAERGTEASPGFALVAGGITTALATLWFVSMMDWMSIAAMQR